MNRNVGADRGLMTTRDIDHILRIHSLYRSRGNPEIDDYYYRNYLWGCQSPCMDFESMFKNSLQRSSESRRGLLGRIDPMSIRGPRKSIVVDHRSGERDLLKEMTDAIRRDLKLFPRSRLQVLEKTEEIYEDLLRMKHKSSPHDQNHASGIEQAKIPFKLGLEKTSSAEYAFIDIVNLCKGKRLVFKIWPLLNMKHKTAILESLLEYTDHLELAHPDPDYARYQNEAFIQFVVSPMVSFIAECSWAMLLKWTTLLVHAPSLPDLLSSDGIVALLCIFLSRAETLGPAKDAEAWTVVTNTLYERCRSKLSLLFGNESGRSKDEYYSWQFLALLAANLTLEKCYELVGLLRERILHAATHSDPQMVSNVNIFLHVVGLDASLLS